MEWGVIEKLWDVMISLWDVISSLLAKYMALRILASSVVAAILVLSALWLLQALRPDGPRLTVLGSTDQADGYVGQPLPDPVEVLVETESGSVPGAIVVFAPMSGDGTATPYVVATDSAGRAKTVWTLGSRSGEQKLVARVLGGDSAWITVPAMDREEPVAVKIKITPDSAVLRFVGDIAPFTAEILDQHGDPFPGSVTWSNKRQCVFRAGSYGFAIAKETGVDSMVAAFDTLRATAPVRVEIGGR